MTKLSVHLVVYNGEKYFPFCLQSLNEQTFKNFSLLIIDNSSLDNSLKHIEEYLKEPKSQRLAKVTKIIKNSKNMGFAGAHNQAIQWTESEYVFLMNQDVLLDANYCQEIIDFLDKHQSVATATGAILKWNFDAMTSMPNSNSLTNFGKTDKIDSLGLKIFPNHQVIELTPEYLTNQTWKTLPQEIFGVSGALPIYRRAALEATKIPIFYKSFKIYLNQNKPKLYEYLDNDFFCYKEDVDLAYRLRLFGYQAYLIPRAYAWHDRTATADGSILKNRKKKSLFVNSHSYKNHLYFLIKNLPAKIWSKYFLKIIYYEGLKLFFLIIFERKTLLVLKEVIKNFAKINQKRTYLQKKIKPAAWQNIETWLRVSK